MQQRIGRYQITGELGRGAMGVVYRAEDPAIGRTVAVKTIHLDAQSDASERLKREAQLAGVLSHPNIVTIYDILEEGRQAHIFMEFVDGPTLEALLARGEAVAPAQAVAWLEQIADALDFAHVKGIVHRDIKPANIMIQQGRTAKVTDFGVARVHSDSTAGATVAGALHGTPNYMAPEQIESRRVDGRADQWALAVLAYELLTGERPFAGDSIAGLLYKIVNDPAPAASRVNATLSADASDVLAKALHKQRDQRYATCTAFVRELREALERKAGWRLLPRGSSETLPTLVPEPEPALNLPPARPVAEEEPVAGAGRRWAGMAALLAVGALAGAGWWFYSRPLELPPPRVEVAPPRAPELKPPAPVPAVTPAPAPSETGNAAPAAATPAVPTPEPGGPATHNVRLESSPVQAVFTVDGSERGCLSPCDIPLTAGSHRITATREGYRTEYRTIEVPAEGSIAFPLTQLTGTIFVQSNPPGATIVIDGRAWPQKTPARATLPVGNHKIEIALEGQPKEEREVSVREGVVSSINVDWNTQKL